MCHREISENTDIYRLWKCRIILEITEYVSLRFWRAKWARVIWESPALDDSKSHGHGWDSQKLGWEGQRILARTIRQRKSVLQRERRIREKKNRELKSVCPSNQGQWGFKEAGGVNCAKCCRGQINQVWKPWCKCRQSEGLSHPFNSDLGLLLENPADFHSCWWKISSFPHSYNVVLSILKRMPFFFLKYMLKSKIIWVLGCWCMFWQGHTACAGLCLGAAHSSRSWASINLCLHCLHCKQLRPQLGLRLLIYATWIISISYQVCQSLPPCPPLSYLPYPPPRWPKFQEAWTSSSVIPILPPKSHSRQGASLEFMVEIL